MMLHRRIMWTARLCFVGDNGMMPRARLACNVAMEAAAKAIKAAKAAAADPVQATAVLSHQVVARRQALGEEL